MHLKRVELTNFRQHRRLDVEFSGNLIAILGQNGSGKSNLIGAIQFALTGEQPGFTKADLTTWGEKEGSVKLVFTAGSANEEFVIVRKTNGDVTLKVGGETIKQSRKVEEALKDKAGIDKELVRQIVFVPQKGIDSILFDDPKNREVAFQKLIGIGAATRIYETLRTEIAAYDKPQGFDEAIGRAKLQLSEQQTIVDAAKKALGRYESAIKTLPSKESLEAEVDSMAGAQSAIDEMLSVSRRLSDAQAAHANALAKVMEAGSVSEEEEVVLRQSVETKSDIVRFLTRLKELSDAAVSARDEGDRVMREAEKELAQFTGDISEVRDAVKKLEAEQLSLEVETNRLRSMMREAHSAGSCPLCGAPATQEDIQKHVGNRIYMLESRLKEVTDSAAKARMDLDHREAEEARHARLLRSSMARMDAAREALQRARDKCVEGVEIDMDTFAVSYKTFTPECLPEIQAQLDSVQKELASVTAAKAKSKAARDDVARLTAQIDLLMQSRKDAAKRLADMGMDPDAARQDDAERCRAVTAKARQNLDAYNGILRDMAAEKGKLQAAEKTIEGSTKFIDDLERKKDAEEEVRGKVDTLKRSRDWFHYANGPRIMSQNMMAMLTKSVNDYLGQFCAPFVVTAEEEGFGFRCLFTDGRVMPDPCPDASMLSGGQKVALAIAFRMAIYMCFGGELGLLSLDEPTAYLDDASIEHLGELLQKVGEVARNKGLQIIMATHEKAIMPFLDTKIDLGALKGE